MPPMTFSKNKTLDSGIRRISLFVRRLYIQRAIGLLMGLLCVVSVLYPQGLGVTAWAGIFATGLAWPQIAYFLSKHSRNPLDSETRNLLIDSFIGGFFVPIILFSFVPSAAFLAMLSMNNMGVGGPKLFGKGVICMVAGILISISIFGIEISPEPTMMIMVVSLPMLIFYPLMTGAIAWEFSKRLRERRNELHTLYSAEKKHAKSLEEANLRLSEAEEKYRTLTEEINDTIFELSTEGTITYISPPITTLTGYEVSDLVGHHFTEFVFPDDMSLLEQKFKKISLGDISPTEYRLKCKGDLYKWVRSSSRTFLQGGNQAGIRGVLTNIEELKRAEDEKVKYLATIHEKQKTEAIGTLAGGIAHDFNNILAAILGYSELLGKVLVDGSGHNHLMGLKDATNRAAGLVRQILAASGRQIETQSEIDLRDILKETGSLLRAAIPATVGIETLVPDQPVFVFADPTQMHQIVMNLATNAFQSMKNHSGTITLELDAEFSMRLAILKVKDDGCGISPESSKRIFEPYYTTKAVGKGSGLGLAVVHGIVVNAGGTVEVDSEMGKGSTFTVQFPLLGKEINAPLNIEADVDLLGGKERIMFVDDEPALQKLGKEILSNLGYDVESFTDPTLALRVFQEEPERWDLLVTDQTMSGLTGNELMSKILAIRPSLPVLICTGYSETLDEEQAVQAGARGLLHKPFPQSELAQAVRKALDSK